MCSCFLSADKTISATSPSHSLLTMHMHYDFPFADPAEGKHSQHPRTQRVLEPSKQADKNSKLWCIDKMVRRFMTGLLLGLDRIGCSSLFFASLLGTTSLPSDNH